MAIAMKKYYMIVVSLVALAAMMMPASAYFNIWYGDNPSDTANDGLSNVVWVGPVMDSGTGYGESFWNGQYNWVDSAYWYGIERRNTITGLLQNSWYYGNYVPSIWPNGARHTVEGYPRQEYMAEFYNYNTLGGDYADQQGNACGYYVYHEESEPFVNYEGMTTYIQYIPTYDPWTYGEFYNWDPAALMWDPGNSVQA